MKRLFNILLIPWWIVRAVYRGVRCGVGLHSWYAARHPGYFRDSAPFPTHWECYDVCTSCRLIRPGSWRPERYTRGEPAAEGEGA